jgi:hypothetical protein
MSVLAGTDLFTAEVLTWRGLVTYFYEKAQLLGTRLALGRN